MTTGFTNRGKGKWKIAELWIDSSKGIFDSKSGNLTRTTWTNPGAPSSSTLANMTNSGDLLIDTTNKNLYTNIGNNSVPSWLLVGGNTSGAGITPAYVQGNIATPTAPGNTTAFTMQGLAGNITPVSTGAVLLTISGTVTNGNTSAGVGVIWQLAYGNGTAPAGNATAAGTIVGPQYEYLNPATVTAVDVKVPFSSQCVITGLAVGTTYWMDLQAKAVGNASAAAFTGVSLTAIEL